MKVSLDITKSVEENANLYFEKSKKARQKIEGAKEALEHSKKEYEKEKKAVQKTLSKMDLSLEPEQAKVITRKHTYWFEKFRYTLTSTGFLCVTASDATSNEILIKKQTNPHDIVIHTELPGSPFTLIKVKHGCKLPQNVMDQTIYEASIATISYSRLWRQNLSEGETFSVWGDQPSKASKEGINVPKGSFVIIGKKTFSSVPLQLAIGIVDKKTVAFHECADVSFSESIQGFSAFLDGKVIAGAPQSVAPYCTSYAQLQPGKEKTSDCAKRLQAFFSKSSGREIDLDDLIRLIPAGGSMITKRETVSTDKMQ
jgi:hypothetical protein